MNRTVKPELLPGSGIIHAAGRRIAAAAGRVAAGTGAAGFTGDRLARNKMNRYKIIGRVGLIGEIGCYAADGHLGLHRCGADLRADIGGGHATGSAGGIRIADDGRRCRPCRNGKLYRGTVCDGAALGVEKKGGDDILGRAVGDRIILCDYDIAF